MSEDHDHDARHVDTPSRAPRQLDTSIGQVDGAAAIIGLSGATLLGDSRLQGRGNGVVRQAIVQRMQQQYGNRVVRQFLQRKEAVLDAPSPQTTQSATKTHQINSVTLSVSQKVLILYLDDGRSLTVPVRLTDDAKLEAGVYQAAAGDAKNQHGYTNVQTGRQFTITWGGIPTDVAISGSPSYLLTVVGTAQSSVPPSATATPTAVPTPVPQPHPTPTPTTTPTPSPGTTPAPQQDAAATEQAALQRIRQNITLAQTVLADATIPEEDKRAVRTALQQARTALQHYTDLQQSGGTRTAAMAPIGLAAAGIVADDATGIGVADDPLLIVLGLAAIAVLIFTNSPAGKEAISQAWLALGRSLQDLSAALSTVLMAQAVGEQVRGNTEVMALHLARLLGEPVGGKGPDEPRDPNNFKHWWKEIKAFLKNIKDKGLSPKQLMRELGKKFSAEEIASIRDALRRAAEQMGESPPDFP